MQDSFEDLCEGCKHGNGNSKDKGGKDSSSNGNTKDRNSNVNTKDCTFDPFSIQSIITIQ